MAMSEETLKAVQQEVAQKQAEIEPQYFAASSEAVQDPEEIKTTVQSLQNIASTQEKLTKVKTQLTEIIDTINNNPSFITRVSKEWGQLPVWQKVTGGIMITIPAFALGFFANLGALFVLGGFSGVTYTAGALILDDHNSCNLSIAENLKKGILNLADVLGVIINTLEDIAKDLAKEIDNFRRENFRLTENVDTLGDRVESLTNQVELLAETERLLREEKDKIEKEINHLEEVVDETKIVLGATTEKLGIVTADYEKNQKELSSKVVELSQVRTELGLEIEKVKAMGSSLQGVLNTMAGAVFADGQQQKDFQNQLILLVTDTKANFMELNSKLKESELKRKATAEELEQANQRYNELLQRHESQIARLEKIGANRNVENISPVINTTGLLNHSFYNDLSVKDSKKHSNSIIDTRSLGIFSAVPVM